MSPPPYTCWASADDWQPGYVILGANVKAIPTPPPQSPVIIGTDGFWGAHEWTVYPQPYRRKFPYLAWIPLPSPNPSDVLTRSVEKTMWQAHSHKPNTRVINPTLLEKLTEEWMSIKAAVEDPFTTVSSDPAFSSVQHPKNAYIRAFAALSRLEKDFEAWRDFVEVFRNFRRSHLELLAFLDWWKDIRSGDDFRSPIRAPTRGVIFDDVELYEKHVHWSVGALLLVRKSVFVLDPVKEVALSPRTLCKTEPMSLLPLLHSLPHYYYPPVVRDIVIDLETASRGYAERSDTFRPTNGCKRKLDKAENRNNDEAGRRAKAAKMSTASLVTQSNNQELRRLADAGPTPDWYPRIQEVWENAVSHVDHNGLAPRDSPRRFALPPVHLFWGGEPQNQRIYYHHYLLLFDEIRNRAECDLPGLTTQEWRSILGNTYWKKQWPKPEGNNPWAFDPNVFWKYGGPLLFGDERSADVAAGRYNPTSRLCCRCDVQLATADDTDIRQVVVYYLNTFHVKEELKEMERLQFPTTFEKRWRNKRLELEAIVEMWDPMSGGPANSDFFCNKKVWRSWVRAVRDVVADWDGFNLWNWNCSSNVRKIGINNLSRQELKDFTTSLLAFLVHSFVNRLGYYPSPLLHPSTFVNHSCAAHQKKFGYGHIIFPFPSST